MKVASNDFGTGWHSLAIGLRGDEIDFLIKQLELIKSGKKDHFVTVDCEDDKQSGLESIEFCVCDDGGHNMQILGGDIAAKQR